MKIYCCACIKKIEARLTDGKEIYPHRPDLHQMPFWKCDTCGNYVGCHYKTKDRTKPLGNIATPDIKKARQHIHKILDPLWMATKDYKLRGVIYWIMTQQLGLKNRGYHTAEIKTIEDAREAYRVAKKMPQLLAQGQAERDEIVKQYLEVKPIEGRKYQIFYKNEWVESVFRMRIQQSCSLHGDPSFVYLFKDGLSVSIDADISLEKRTEEIKKLIKPIC